MSHMAIVGWDGTDLSSGAAEWLAERQCRSNRPLVLVTVVPPADNSGGAGTASAAVTTARREAEWESARLRESFPGLVATVRIVEGDVVDVLTAMSCPANILAVGHRRGMPGQRGSTTSVGERLAMTAPGPVALVSGHRGTTASGVVVGVDGGEASLAALGFAAQEAQDRGQAFLAIHAWLNPLGTFDDPREERATTALLQQRHESLLEQSLQPVIAAHPTMTIRRRVVQGLAVKELLGAGTQAQLLVIGNHGRNLVAPSLLGSVSYAVVHDPTSTIVVIKNARPTVPRSAGAPSSLPQARSVHGGLGTPFHAEGSQKT